MKEKTSVITLINGDILRVDNDVINCPCCMNGSMVLKEAGEDEAVYECVKCRSTIKIPCVSIKTE